MPPVAVSRYKPKPGDGTPVSRSPLPSAPAPGYGAPAVDPAPNPIPGGWDPRKAGPQMSADGKASLGANNGFNNANTWQGYYGQILRGQDAQGQREGQTQDSRATADAFFNKGAVATPEFTAGQRPEADPWSFDQTRPEFENDDALADRFTRFSGLIGGPTPEVQDVAGGGAAFERYGQGALAKMSQVLQDRTRDVTDSAAGRGRLNTGFYDQDVGTLQRSIAEEARADMLMKALDAARLDQDAATGNADRRLKASLEGNKNARDLLEFSADRTDQGNKDRQGAFESDRDFSRGVYMDDRDELDSDFEDDRDYGEDAYRYRRDANRGDFESDRDYLEKRYITDEGLLDNETTRNIDLWAGARDWRYTQANQEAEEAKHKGFRGFLNDYAAPVANVVKKFIPGQGGGKE